MRLSLLYKMALTTTQFKSGHQIRQGSFVKVSFSTMHAYLLSKLFCAIKTKSFREHFIIKIFRIESSTNPQNFNTIESNQVLKSVDFYLKNYVGYLQKIDIF